jgi:hypothetical protein
MHVRGERHRRIEMAHITRFFKANRKLYLSTLLIMNSKGKCRQEMN